MQGGKDKFGVGRNSDMTANAFIEFRNEVSKLGHVIDSVMEINIFVGP